jgi:hypothetical protein
MIDRANESANAALLRIARTVHRHVAELQEIGENDMGILTRKFASKFHSGVEALRQFDFWMQQVAAELKRQGAR